MRNPYAQCAIARDVSRADDKCEAMETCRSAEFAGATPPSFLDPGPMLTETTPRVTYAPQA
jgi:hypothetical protein